MTVSENRELDIWYLVHRTEKLIARLTGLEIYPLLARYLKFTRVSNRARAPWKFLLPLVVTTSRDCRFCSCVPRDAACAACPLSFTPAIIAI